MKSLNSIPVTKRIFDLTLVFLSLPVSLPLLLVIALFVRLKIGAPVMFRQSRPGLGGELFELVKFRSMTDDVGPDGKPLPDEERLLPFGKLLRTTSLDELPELWNVLKGEMSLVGPRPLLPEYLPLYSPQQARRHEALPGITGLAQVTGRNALSWDERFALDTWYVENRSLCLDIKIILRTLHKVIASEGIAAEGSETMPLFTGDRDNDQ